MRDTQRKRLYDAEREAIWDMGRKLPQVEECERYVARVLASKWWMDRCPVRCIQIKDGRGCRWATMRGRVIVLPKWARKELVVLHELGHVLTYQGARTASHGREFAAAYLGLVQRFMGGMAARELKAAFKRHRVRYRPKRQLSPERLAALRERFQAFLARKKNGAAV